jgi:hypothetical protein
MALVNLTFEHRKWILKCYWKLENVEYALRLPDLTPLDFFLLGALKNAVYTSKPRTLQHLRRYIVIVCQCTISNNAEVCKFVTRRQQCIATDGWHFEYL